MSRILRTDIRILLFLGPMQPKIDYRACGRARLENLMKRLLEHGRALLISVLVLFTFSGISFASKCNISRTGVMLVIELPKGFAHIGVKEAGEAGKRKHVRATDRSRKRPAGPPVPRTPGTGVVPVSRNFAAGDAAFSCICQVVVLLLFGDFGSLRDNRSAPATITTGSIADWQFDSDSCDPALISLSPGHGKIEGRCMSGTIVYPRRWKRKHNIISGKRRQLVVAARRSLAQQGCVVPM